MQPAALDLTPGLFVAAAILLSLERVTYALAWHRPDRFDRVTRRLGFRDPVTGLEAFFYGFKLVQGLVFAGWCAYFGALAGWPPGLATVPAVAGAALVVIGQTLNGAVFLRLGRVGVFYGNRFGHPVPWCDGFPFSLLDHPQYAGAVISIWGLFLLARFPHDDWFALPLLETAYYAIGAHLERPVPVVADAAR
jgi:methylene-fatty-acyl-phospholipid synthase